MLLADAVFSSLTFATVPVPPTILQMEIGVSGILDPEKAAKHALGSGGAPQEDRRRLRERDRRPADISGSKRSFIIILIRRAKKGHPNSGCPFQTRDFGLLLLACPAKSPGKRAQSRQACDKHGQTRRFRYRNGCNCRKRRNWKQQNCCEQHGDCGNTRL
jgi:hypothetical protein